MAAYLAKEASSIHSIVVGFLGHCKCILLDRTHTTDNCAKGNCSKRTNELSRVK